MLRVSADTLVLAQNTGSFSTERIAVFKTTFLLKRAGLFGKALVLKSQKIPWAASVPRAVLCPRLCTSPRPLTLLKRDTYSEGKCCQYSDGEYKITVNGEPGACSSNVDF